MILNITYAQAVEQAAALRALGANRDVYLSKGPYPWHLVKMCSDGGTHRIEINTDVRFTGYDSETDLTFRWSFDIEPRSANGTGSYDIDVTGCHEVLSVLRGEAREFFRLYLLEAADKVRSKGREFENIAKRQYGTADMLTRAASPEV